MKNLFVGRQPILDIKGNLFAFELLYRDGHTNAFPNISPETAKVQVIMNTYLSPGFEELATNRTFINFCDRLLLSDIFETLPPQKVVIEVLETVEITPVIIQRLKEIKAMGFEIALDDFVMDRENVNYTELFRIVKYIKVDFRLTEKENRWAIERLKARYPHIILLAEKVETKAEFEEAKQTGYSLFQGYYFSKPDVLVSRDIPVEMPIYFELLRLLSQKNVDLERISDLVMKDVSLTYKLLKYVNTYAFQSSTKITSVRQATVRIGIAGLKKWVQFIIIFQRNEGNNAGYHKTLVHYSLMRANVCEQLAIETNQKNKDEYYMLGIFSLLHLILKKPPQDIYPTLPVPKIISGTLSGVETDFTLYLKITELIEGMNFPEAVKLAKKLNISAERLSEITLTALKLQAK